MSIATPAAPGPGVPGIEEATPDAASVPAAPPATRAHGLRLAHLWAIVPLAAAWFAASIDFIEPFDFWWNVKSGEIMTQTGQFLGTDVLVWTPVRLPYSNPQWGSQLILYWLYAISPYLVLTLRAIIITATVAIILWACMGRARTLRPAALATLVAYLTAWTNYGMRPQLLAFLPFVGTLLILERKDEHPRWLPLLVPIMLFWVNIHGSFFLGVALLGVYGLGTLVEKLWTPEGRRWLTSRTAAWQASWLVATALASLANPYFVGIYNYFFTATNDPIARSLNMEWQPPTIYDGTGQLFFAQLLIFGASIYFSRRRLRFTEILIVLAFGYLALTSLRNVMWWGWVTAPIMAANFAAIKFRRGEARAGSEQPGGAVQHPDPEPPPARVEVPALNWAFALLLVGGALLFTPLWREANPFVPASARGALSSNTPVELADFLKSANPPAPLFNYMEWGGYLEWELYPRYQMFIDGRFEARQVDVWKDYLSISRARADWQKTLDKYGIRTLVLEKSFDSELIPFLATSPQWHKAYEDKLGVVYVRQ